MYDFSFRGVLLWQCNIFSGQDFKLFRTTNDVHLDYQSCVEDGGKVVSHVFCLPNSYRKDVLPPTSL